MKYLTALIFVSLAGCASLAPEDASTQWIEPSKAIQEAAGHPEKGVQGTFAMTVQATGMGAANHLFLNSESDYRDQRNLSVDIEPDALRSLARQLGAEPDQVLKGKHILVTGTAKRTKILFYENGQPTDKYYYQTHVVVSNPAQIRIAKNERADS